MKVRPIITTLMAAVVANGCLTAAPVGPTSTSASPTVLVVTPAPTATPAPRPLRAGKHSSNYFRPRLSYVVPDGWANTVDIFDQFDLQLIDSGASIRLFHDEFGQTPADIADWLLTRTGVEVASFPEDVSVGGLTGLRLDLDAAEGAEQDPNGEGLEVLILSGSAVLAFWIATGEIVRLWLLTHGDSTVLIWTDVYDHEISSWIDISDTIVQGFQFSQ